MSTEKRQGAPPPLWMRKIAESNNINENKIVDYEYVARKFKTTVRAIRCLSTKIKYDSFRIPNPRGGTFKKFYLSSFARSVRKHVESYRWLS